MSRKNRTLVSFTAFFGAPLSLLSWILSHHPIPASESTMTWALNTPSASKAGFPFVAFEIPQSPLGGDFIPRSMHGGLILNSLFWLAIGIVAALLLIRFAPAWAEKRWKIALACGMAAFVLHAALFAIWFD